MEVIENCGPAINQFSGTSIGIELHNRQFSVHTPNNLVNVNPGVCRALALGLGKDYIQHAGKPLFFSLTHNLEISHT